MNLCLNIYLHVYGCDVLFTPAHQWLYSHLEGHAVLQFLCWTLYPTSLCALSTSFSHSICPYSAGQCILEENHNNNSMHIAIHVFNVK